MIFDLIRRANSTDYEYGDLVAPATPNDHVYMCTTPGTSGSSPPIFATGTGSTTADGTVVWIEHNPTGITFTGALVFQTQPAYGSYRRRRQYVQTIEYAAGDVPYVYDKEIQAVNRRELSWSDMVAADLTVLLNFLTITRAAVFSFTFTDDEDTDHEAVIINGNEIISAATAHGFRGQISIELLLLS